MSIPVILQFVAFSLLVGIGVSIAYVIPKVLSLAQRVKSDEEALQKIALQIEVSVAMISETFHNMQQTHGAAIEEKSDGANGNAYYIRLRKDVVAQDAEIRFAALNDWVNTNYLAILHRASRGWSSPADLIAHIPAYFEAQAEISAGDILLISTRGYPEKVAVRLRDVDAVNHEILSGRTDIRDEDPAGVHQHHVAS